MQLDSILPNDFSGIFYFTNFTEQEFKAKWNKVEYTFPALKTSPMIISGATPEEVQNIRKKFARELAEREFYASEKFGKMNNIPMGGTPALYTENDLTPYVQRCLEPLPIEQAKAVIVEPETVQVEKKLTRDQKGKTRSRVLEGTESLIEEGQVLS